MKILIINYHFPPSQTAHSYRWALLRKYFKDCGHVVDVIAGGLRDINDYNSGINRVNFPGTLKKNTVDTIDPNITKLNRLSVLSMLKEKVVSMLKRVYRKSFWPDGLWHWLPMALYRTFTLRKNKYDLVISYSPTFSAVLAGYFYKRLNPNCTFIIDFGDPYSVSKEMPVNNYMLYSKLNRFAENSAFSLSKLITFTNSKTYKLYVNSYPKIKVFDISPHLVDTELFYSNENIKNQSLISLVYIGAFHRGIREPEFTLEVLSNLKKKCPSIYVEFYGALNGVPFNSNSNIVHKGVVERKEAIDIMRNVNILINIENEDCPMTPSKINEYIATGKPILNFLSSTGESSFSDYPLVLNVDIKTSIDDIQRFIEVSITKRLSRLDVDELLKGKTTQDIGNYYLQAVNNR